MIICWGTSYWQKQGNKSVHDTAPKVSKQTTWETCFTHQQTWGGGGGVQCYTAQSKHLIYSSYWLLHPVILPTVRKTFWLSRCISQVFLLYKPQWNTSWAFPQKLDIWYYVKITCYLQTWEYHCCFDWKINCALHTKKIIKVKLFGSSLVFI